MKKVGRFTIDETDKKQGTILVTFYNYDEASLRERGLKDDGSELWKVVYNLNIPINEKGFLSGEDLLGFLESNYPWDFFERENLKLSLPEQPKNESVLEGFEGRISKEEIEPNQKNLEQQLKSYYGKENDINYLKHVIYETLEELGIIK